MACCPNTSSPPTASVPPNGPVRENLVMPSTQIFMAVPTTPAPTNLAQPLSLRCSPRLALAPKRACLQSSRTPRPILLTHASSFRVEWGRTQGVYTWEFESRVTPLTANPLRMVITVRRQGGFRGNHVCGPVPVAWSRLETFSRPHTVCPRIPRRRRLSVRRRLSLACHASSLRRRRRCLRRAAQRARDLDHTLCQRRHSCDTWRC